MSMSYDDCRADISITDYNNGYDDGFEAGYEEGLKSGKDERDRMIAKFLLESIKDY